MKKYKVILHPDAETEINSSFEWGSRAWGIENAIAWVRQIRQTIKNRLTSMPLSCPLAPESEELDIPVRQLIVGRIEFSLLSKKGPSRFFILEAPMSPQLYSSEEAEA